MNGFLKISALVGCLIATGCDGRVEIQVDKDKGVGVKAPGVDVQVKKGEGVHVEAPGTDVEVGPEGVRVDAPGADVNVKKDSSSSGSPD